MHELPLIAPRRAEMTRQGFWRDETIDDYLRHFAASQPDKPAIIAYSGGRAVRLSYRELDAVVTRTALGLARLGVGKGDVVAIQLPNWWHFPVLHLACVRLGAVTNPLMVIFRQRELRFMLRFSRAKVMIVPHAFRGHDFPAMMAGLRGELPDLDHVVVAGGSGPDGYDTVFGTGGALGAPDETAADLFARDKPGADDLIQLLYTSGTTGEPKGVMHTSNTLLSNLHPFAERLGLRAADVIHMPSPLAHQLGFMYGVVLPVLLGATAVLQDIFDPREMARQLVQERCTFTMAATPFLNDLTEYLAQSGIATPDLRVFVSAGAPIPRALVTRASAVMGASIISAWGMSENGAVTTTSPSDSLEKIFNTDGHALAGMAVRVVDVRDEVVPSGTDGRLQVRGCSNFAGYLKRPDLNLIDADGWFETGDIARMDEDGYIRISGRSKDIIIRGGENIPVVEIENLLFRHPAIAEVAIVGAPDPRLGERACAYVVTRPNKGLTFEEMTAFLLEQQIATQYLPERLSVVEALPRTPSGKIQKFKLRELAKGEGQEPL